MIIVLAYSYIVYHFYEVWWLLSYKQFFMQTLENAFLTNSMAITLL